MCPSNTFVKLKYDGVAISLIYENGQLIKGVTRGDGVRGEVVTNNIRTIQAIPLKLVGDFPKKLKLEVKLFSNSCF